MRGAIRFLCLVVAIAGCAFLETCILLGLWFWWWPPEDVAWPFHLELFHILDVGSWSWFGSTIIVLLAVTVGPFKRALDNFRSRVDHAIMRVVQACSH